jgi:hypothetical protein
MVRWLAVFVVLFGGCSTDAPGPRERCDDLVDLLCERVSGCPNGGTTQQECLTLPAADLSCPEATGVSGAYDQCIDDLTVSPCSVLVRADGTVEMPESCDAAILYPR